MAKLEKSSRVFAGNLLPAAGIYGIDGAHCFAEFRAQHIVAGQVRGRFDSVSGTIQIAENPLFSTIHITIESASVSTHNPERDKDLRSERFFDVQKFPQITFVSSGLKTEPEGRLAVEGDLMLRGVTRPVVMDVAFSGIVDDPWGNTRAAFRAVTRINRRDFGLLADLDRETGGLLVGKDVTIDIAVEALYKGQVEP